MIFVLFCFHLGRICDLCFKQKCWKSFYSLDKNILFSYEIIRGIQQVTSISFFPSVGNQSGNERKHILHSWVADQSTAFLLARGSHLNVWVAEKLVFYCIFFYPCLPSTTRLFIETPHFDKGQPWTTFHQMRLRKQTNKQTIEKTNMTQPAELDWSCHAITIAWRRKLWDSHSFSMIKYKMFSLGYFHLSVLFWF